MVWSWPVKNYFGPREAKPVEPEQTITHSCDTFTVFDDEQGLPEPGPDGYVTIGSQPADGTAPAAEKPTPGDASTPQQSQA
jgi:hypothetical protein